MCTKGNNVVGFKLNLHPNKAKTVAKQAVTDVDIESLQKSLLQQNATQLEFTSQFHKLFDDISNAISTEFFNSQYKETPILKKLKEIQAKVSKAKTIDEIASLRKNFESIISSENTQKSINAANQLGVNALINKK